MKDYIFSLFLLSILISCSSPSNNNTENVQENTIAIESSEKNSDTGTIVFFGNSLSAGYGVDPDQAFPALIQKKIDSLGLNYQVINAGLSGETTASGKNRVDWVLKQEVDIFILELGGNDGLRGIPTKETKSNLEEIIAKVRATYPNAKIILAGMQIPPNMGGTYANDFREVFVDLAAEMNLPLIMFLLEGVGGNPDLNLQDGIHPNEKGHKIVAENVWRVLQKEL